MQCCYICRYSEAGGTAPPKRVAPGLYGCASTKGSSGMFELRYTVRAQVLGRERCGELRRWDFMATVRLSCQCVITKVGPSRMRINTTYIVYLPAPKANANVLRKCPKRIIRPIYGWPKRILRTVATASFLCLQRLAALLAVPASTRDGRCS